MSIESYVRAAPKAELHVHLEGAIRPTTLLTLARRHNVVLPCETPEELRAWLRFRDFDHFAETFSTLSGCLRTADDYELIAYELAEDLARQNARLAEVHFLPAFHARNGVSEGVYLDGLSRARKRAQDEFGVELAWIFDLGRAWRGGEAETWRWASYAVDVAIEAHSEGVLALGLGGPKVGHPPERFAALFERGRSVGLHSVPHAGEHVGPTSIRGHWRPLLLSGSRTASEPSRTPY